MTTSVTTKGELFFIINGKNKLYNTNAEPSFSSASRMMRYVNLLEAPDFFIKATTAMAIDI